MIDDSLKILKIGKEVTWIKSYSNAAVTQEHRVIAFIMTSDPSSCPLKLMVLRIDREIKSR